MFKKINKFFRKNLKKSPFKINCGHCYHWAMIAYVIGGAKGKLVTVEDHGGHAFLYQDGKFFDSQALDGVDDWEELPIFKNDSTHEEDAMFQPPDEFMEYWDFFGVNNWQSDIVKNGIKSCV